MNTRESWHRISQQLKPDELTVPLQGGVKETCDSVMQQFEEKRLDAKLCCN